MVGTRTDRSAGRTVRRRDRGARATTTRGDLDDDEYARARAVLGDKALIETLTLVGYYALLALQMRVHRVPRPGDG